MLIRKDDFFYVSTEITGETEMIPLEPHDTYEIRELIERDDIEELLVTMCEENQELMELIENDFEKGGSLVEKIITEIIDQRNKLIASVTETIARAKLEALYERMRYDALIDKVEPEKKQVLELEAIFSDDFDEDMPS